MATDAKRGPGKRNRVDSVPLLLRVTPAMDVELEALAQRGMLGKNRAEVAVYILREWLWEHIEKSRVQASAASVGGRKGQTT